MKDDEVVQKQDYTEEEYDNGFLRWMSIGVVVVAVAGFIALAWYAYHNGGKAESPESVALIEADKSPLKEAPADPGGLQFPHQDKTVYETISNNAGAPRPAAERMLPPPEEPMKIDQANDNASTPSTETESYVNPNVKSAAGETPRNSSEKNNALQVFEADDTVAAPMAAGGASPKIIHIDPATGNTTTVTTKTVMAPEEPAPSLGAMESVTVGDAPVATTAKPVTIKAKEAAKAEPAVSPRTAESTATGNKKVQLGEFRSEKEANDAWAKIRNANSAIVSGKKQTVQRADLGEKGVFYRLQLAGFSSEADAKSLCDKLAAKKQGCFLVKSN